MKDRIKEFCAFLQIPISEFERRCGMSNGYVSSIRKGIGVSKLENVLIEFPLLNKSWLLYGEGEMLKENINVNADNGSAASAMGDATVTGSNNNELSPEVIELLKRKDAQIDSLLKEVSHLIDIISKSK